MSNSSEYIQAMQSFSKSIETLANAILEQIKNAENGDENTVDNTSNRNQTQNIIDIAAKLDVVSENVENTQNNTKDILEIVKSIKKEKESSGLTALFDKKKKKVAGVADGIKDIALMAGAIMAVGVAFKIVGDVDFASVLALSIALPLVATAFGKVNESIKSPKEAMNTSIAMIFMAGGLTASGILLSFMPSFSITQMIGMVAVSAAMGVSMYLLANAADELGVRKLSALYGLIPAMPLAAAGIAASGAILQNMPLIGMEQFLSAIGVGVAMGASMIPLAYAAKAIGKDTRNLFMMSLAMPAIAAGIVASAWVLQDIPDIDFAGMIETTTGITASLLIMGAGMWALNKMGVDPKTAAIGAILMPIIATGLMLSSHVLSAGNYEDGPSLDWAQGFGLSMIASIPVVVAYGALASTGFGAIVIGAGILSMLAVAKGIAEVSDIVAGGNYTGGPSVEWAQGIGMSLIAFTNAIGSLKPNLFDMLFSSDTMSSKIESIVTIGSALKDVAAVIKGGDYTGGPSEQWSRGVGMALVTFTTAIGTLKPNLFERLLGDSLDQNIESIVKLGGALRRVGFAVGKDSSMYTGGPDKRWAEGVGMSITAFAGALGKVKPGFFDRLFGDTLDGQIDGMIAIARAMKQIGYAIGSDTSMYSGGPDKKWSEGVGTAVTSFASAIATLADEIDPEDVTNWVWPMKQIAGIMAYFSTRMKGLSFDNYPSKNWSQGIFAFMDGIKDFDSDTSTNKTIKNITRLANANFKLARSISTIAYALKKVDKVPDLSNLYGGLLALSVMNGYNLNKVLDTVSGKKQEFKDLLQIVNKDSNLNIPQSSFTYSVPNAFGVNNNPGAISGGGGGTVVRQSSPEPQKPQEVIIKNDQSTEVLNKLVNIANDLKSILDEIADNTAKQYKPGNGVPTI